MKNTTEIGNVVIDYHEDGHVIHTSFKPKAKVNFDKRLVMDLRQVEGDTNPEHIKMGAEAIFASWFKGIVDIELADVATSKIESKIVDCQKWDNGKVKRCEISFSFVEELPDDKG